MLKMNNCALTMRKYEMDEGKKTHFVEYKSMLIIIDSECCIVNHDFVVRVCVISKNLENCAQFLYSFILLSRTCRTCQWTSVFLNYVPTTSRYNLWVSLCFASVYFSNSTRLDSTGIDWHRINIRIMSCNRHMEIPQMRPFRAHEFLQTKHTNKQWL